MRLRIAIIGAGIGGLGLAIRLRRAGFRDVTVFEKRDGVGGTWRANTYPGAACDIPSHLYSYSFAPNPHWSRAYATQPEILAYLEDCADRFDIRPHLRCGTAITSARWSEDTCTWQLADQHGEHHTADVLVSAVGLLDVPSSPDIPGLDRFAGTVFHTADWNHDHALTGRVAVIGTGASAIQCIPPVAEEASSLSVFLRSAPYVLPRADRAFTDEERRRFAARPWAAKRHRWRIYHDHERATVVRADDSQGHQIAAFAHAYRAHKVPDPVLQEGLTPNYQLGCKRILLSSDFFPAMCRDNVHLVTTPINAISEGAVLTEDGTRHPVDTIILATGFRASEFLSTLEITGRGGRRLRDDWRDGARAHLGLAVYGYPNFFVLYGPNTNQGGNSLVFILESQAAYVVRALKLMRRRAIASMEVHEHVMDRYNEELERALQGSVWRSGCASYFQGPGGRIVTQLPHDTRWYWRRTRVLRRRDYDIRLRR